MNELEVIIYLANKLSLRIVLVSSHLAERPLYELVSLSIQEHSCILIGRTIYCCKTSLMSIRKQSICIVSI